MTWTSKEIGDLGGKVCVVTGANSGLGREIARALAANGAEVIMACRNPTKAAEAERAILARHPQARLTQVTLDLASLASVRRAAEQIRAAHDHLDVLVNNAGLMALDRAMTEDGFEMQFGVNHLGHFVITAELLPPLLATPGSRIANMSSMGHRGGHIDFANLNAERSYGRWPAYFQSKLANLLFTAELDRRLRAATGHSTMALAAHPGGTRTDLGAEGSGLAAKLWQSVAPLVMQPVGAGAQPMLRAVTDPAAEGGQFYGCRFMTFGAPVLETPSRSARDPADAARLWDESARLTGTNYPI